MRNNKPFIPRPLKRYRGTIWRSYTLTDLILLFAFALVTFLVINALNQALWINILVALGMLLPYPFVVIPWDEEKLYVRFYYFLVFLFTKKRYSKKQTKWLNPYTQITNGFVYVSNKKVLGFVELKGFNLDLLPDNEQFYRINQFLNMVKTVPNFSLVTAKLPLNYQNQANHLEKIQKNFIKNTFLKSVALLEQSIFNRLIDNQTNYGNKYFLVLEASSQKEIENKYASVYQYLQQALLKPQLVKDSKVVEMVLAKLNLNFESDKKVVFQNRQIKQQNGKTKTYQQIVCVKNLPLQAYEGWLANVTSNQHDWIMHVTKMDKIKTTKKLDKVISDLRGRLGQNNKASDQVKSEVYLNGLENLNELVHMDGEEFVSINIFVCLKAKTKKGLHKAFKELKTNLIGYQMRINGLTFKQKDALTSMFWGTKVSRSMWSTELSSLALAYGFPFVSDEHRDPQGIYLGYSTTSNTNIFFDPRVRNAQRKNGNIYILGTSGGGKSSTSKKLIKNLVLSGDKLFCLDPEREYDLICENLGGSWINFGTDTSVKKQNKVINPLQFLQNESDDRDLLQNHLQFLEQFFSVLFPELRHKELTFLRQALLETYEAKKINVNNSFKKRANNKYPLMGDVVATIKTLLNNEKDSYNIPIWKELLIFMSVFTHNTPENTMWNSYTNFDLYDGYLTVADLQTLFSSGNKRLGNAQMFLLLKIVNNAMIQNKLFKEKQNSNRHFGIVIDEAHLLVDEEQPFALNFMYEMAKRARKYNAYVIITTQNVADFVGSNRATRDKTKAILNVSQYGFILPMNAGDISDLDSLLKASGGLMPNEKEAISLGGTGQALFINGTKNRQIINIDIAKEEFLIWEPKGDKQDE